MRVVLAWVFRKKAVGVEECCCYVEFDIVALSRRRETESPLDEGVISAVDSVTSGNFTGFAKLPLFSVGRRAEE